MEVVLKLSGVLLGVSARTLIPYLRKVREGKTAEFQKSYLTSAVASGVLAVIITLLIFPQFRPEGICVDAEGYVKLFCAAFGFGFGWNTIVNEIAKWGGAFKGGRHEGKVE